MTTTTTPLHAQIAAVRASKSHTQRWATPVSIWVDRYQYSQCWDLASFDADIRTVIREATWAGADIQVTS